MEKDPSLSGFAHYCKDVLQRQVQGRIVRNQETARSALATIVTMIESGQISSVEEATALIRDSAGQKWALRVQKEWVKSRFNAKSACRS